MSERLTPERLAEFEDLAAGKLTEYRRAVMLAEGEHGSHVWCYDPRPDGSGPLNLHSEECHLRTLLAHIDAQQAEIDSLVGQAAALRDALEDCAGGCVWWPGAEAPRYCIQHSEREPCPHTEALAVLADTEAVARRFLLQGARELVKRACKFRDGTTPYWEIKARNWIQNKLADMEQEIELDNREATKKP